MPQKGRNMTILLDNGVGEFVKNVVPPPQYPQQLEKYTKNDMKERGVKDHIIPHIYEKKICEMLKAILNLYQSSSETMKLSLKEKLRST